MYRYYEGRGYQWYFLMTDADEQPVKLIDPTDFEILEFFSDGEQQLARNVAVDIDADRQYMNTRISHLNGANLLERIGPAPNSGLYRITPRGIAALRLREEYDAGREWEAMIDDRAERIEIVRPQIVDDAE